MSAKVFSIVVVKKKRPVIRTFFSTTTYTIPSVFRNVLLKSGINVHTMHLCYAGLVWKDEHRTSNVQHRILNEKKGNRRIISDIRYEYQNGRSTGSQPWAESKGWKETDIVNKWNQRYEPQSKLWTQKGTRFARTSYPAAELRGILWLNCGAERHHYSMFDVGRSMFDVHPFCVRCAFSNPFTPHPEHFGPYTFYNFIVYITHNYLNYFLLFLHFFSLFPKV
jgi:hypothetical protein